jgi:hypothetical protein
LGLGFAALMEYRDSTFRTDDEVVAVLALPVLAMIPAMQTTAEKRHARRQKIRFVAVSAATLVIAVAVIAWRFNLVNRFLR